MLAQSFMTAADLGLTEEQHSALIKTLALMDAGKMRHTPVDDRVAFGDEFTGHFNMKFVNTRMPCGTVCCIQGTAEIVGNTRLHPPMESPLRELFYPGSVSGHENLALCQMYTGNYGDITVPQAAMALRSYLTTGDARWDLALADQVSHAHENPRKEREGSR